LQFEKFSGINSKEGLLIMLILVRLIGIYIAVMGMLFLLNPGALLSYTAFWGRKKRLYCLGASRIIMGLVVLSCVGQCRLRVPAAIVGILLIITGIPYFTVKLGRQKEMVGRWGKRPESAVRILGLVIFVIGALLVYAA
jgi:uncharacterized protein YjeT (DUF2065 family)